MSRYARLPEFNAGIKGRSEDDARKVMQRFTEQLQKSGEKGVLQVSLGEDGGAEKRSFHWSAPVTPHEGEVRAERAERPDLEVLTSAETFWSMAAGTYSPVEALRDGRLRLRGDLNLGKRLLRHLAGPDGRVDCG